MQVFRGFHHPGIAAQCALTIGNFDGVHRGHQAMLALLLSEARHRGLPTCVLTFEPHPRDFFSMKMGKPALAPARIATLRDKLQELARCGIDQVVVLRFDEALASLSAQDFIQQVLVDGLGTRYALVGDDFRFGAKRQGDYATLDAAGQRLGFDVARMMSYEVHGLRVSSSAVREALAAGDMDGAARLLGRPYAISGHVIHGQKLGRQLAESAPGAADGFRTLNLKFDHDKPAAHGIFAVRVHGLDGEASGPGAAPGVAQPSFAHSGPAPLPATGPTALNAPSPLVLDGVASLGVRPTVEDAGRVLLEVHALDWPVALAERLGPREAYGKLVRVELLHKLRDEARYDGLDALTAAIREDVRQARAYFAQQASPHAAVRRQTTRDRI
ncbi:bifunctional riboflavin kinase/FAD synthetase [Roseateles amylovorans]|uniref:Bifunctional riboflavin kinase/FMN adenylyltransferase n=1 Tax=Roseateles amylovorans TaxID=2978473 RepID=A0ABY6B7Y1_9BURK|nr:bifunctional riboflavin kinase/FAD synthetase [Roseateles amylovorans]UXH80468.1 bifunctional riboflavin kinase/FAD synthetase [Roseateles amylovorans]